MKIGILGTRGIPNYYGGFEQFAEYFATYVANQNHEIFVYNSHKHPYKESNFKGVQIIHCYDPEYIIGTAGQYIYDLNCILDARKRNFDIILQLGYTSSSIWFGLHPKEAIVITNMDGLEWKRTKYSKPIRKLLLWAEKLAAVSSSGSPLNNGCLHLPQRASSAGFSVGKRFKPLQFGQAIIMLSSRFRLQADIWRLASYF